MIKKMSKTNEAYKTIGEVAKILDSNFKTKKKNYHAYNTFLGKRI